MKLKEYLKINKMNAKGFAVSIGKSVNYISQVANERLQPSLESARTIEKMTHGQVTVDEMRYFAKVTCPTCGKKCKSVINSKKPSLIKK